MSAIAVWGGKVICVNLHGSGIGEHKDLWGMSEIG